MEGGVDEVVEVNCVGGGDPGAYAGMLKRKLDLYCAAVAKSMGDGPIRVANSNAIDGTVVQGKPANSGTSKEQSDDDGDLEENTDPTNTKRMRRVLSNRESARRSRKRKQAHLNDLESQVTQLRAENASFLKRLTDMTQKYKEATLDNRNLTADVETMRRKISDFLMGTSETRLDTASSTTTTSVCHHKLHSQLEVTMGADLIKQTKEVLHVAKRVDGEDGQRERRQCLLSAESKARQGRHAVREEKAPGPKAMHGRPSMHPWRAVTKWSRGEPRWKPDARHEKLGWFAAQEGWCKEQRKERFSFHARLLWILF